MHLASFKWLINLLYHRDLSLTLNLMSCYVLFYPRTNSQDNSVFVLYLGCWWYLLPTYYWRPCQLFARPETRPLDVLRYIIRYHTEQCNQEILRSGKTLKVSHGRIVLVLVGFYNLLTGWTLVRATSLVTVIITWYCVTDDTCIICIQK